jgi:transcriptional regulator with XRE-family HTH domain
MGIIVCGRIVRKCRILQIMNTQLLEELGSRIREHRKALGLTQEALAARADIDRSYIGGVERGERNLTFTVLCEICLALGCDVATLTKNLPEFNQ